jgi:hypothetical protein
MYSVNPENLKGFINWFHHGKLHTILCLAVGSRNPFILPSTIIKCFHTVDNRTNDEESIMSVLKRESHNFFLGASDDEAYSPRDQQGQQQQQQQGGLPPRPPSARSRDKSPRSNTPSSEKSPRSNTPSSGHHSAGSKLSGSGSLQEGCLRNLLIELYYAI